MISTLILSTLGAALIVILIRFLIYRTAVNELQNLHYLPRVSEPREFLAEDRTKCHADHVGHGLDRQTTAAVGVLKAIHVGGRFVVMCIICFDHSISVNNCICIFILLYSRLGSYFIFAIRVLMLIRTHADNSSLC